MAILATGKMGKDFDPVPAGTQIARCVTVVDCGMQKTEWQGQEKWQHKVWIGFEVPSFRVKWKDKDDKEHDGPGLIGKMYTNNISDKASLGQHLSSWRGKSFTGNEIKEGYDVSVLLDKPCQLSITHRESKDGSRVYANIMGIMGIPPGMPVPDRETDLTLYDPTTSEAAAVFQNLPEWLQEKVTFGHRLDQKPSTVNQGVSERNPPPIERYNDDDFIDEIPF